MPATILNQVVTHVSYTPEMAMRQAGFHMLRHPHKFYKCIEQELLDTGESYESYCYNVFHSLIWGDDLVAAVFSDMWNVSISIVSPAYRYPIDLWHGSEDPDIVLIANGGSYMSEGKKTTHFSSSRKIDKNFKMPGSELVNYTVGINPDLVYKKLEPTLLHDATQARKKAIEEYTKSQSEKSLNMLCQVTKSIERLDRHIAGLIHESDRKKDQRKMIEYQLTELGISAEKIQIATKQKELPYILTEDVEREKIREDRKRKREEELKEETRKKQCRETIKMKDGKIISTGDEEVVAVEGEEEELTHEQKLIKQQQEMIKNYETLVQQHENQLIQNNLRIKELEAAAAQGTQQIQQQQMVAGQSSLPAIPSLSNLPGIFDPGLDVFEIHDQPLQSEAQPVRNPMAVENLLKKDSWKFLPKFAAKQEPVETTQEVGGGAEEQQQVQQQESVEILTLPPQGSSNIVYVPKKVNEKTALVLVPPPEKVVLTKRNNPGRPIPKDDRKGHRFYCEECSCNYSKKSDLTKHIKWMCQKTEFDFICDGCQKGFYTDDGVHEHYYEKHLKQFLYFCTQYGKGFHHKSKRSNHKNACPKKDAEETFAKRAPYDEKLELTFLCRQKVNIDIPEKVQAITDEIR
ncbi:MAG: hypothetical protein MJE68_04495, partial [Proteobacteria bacterium]|nr:hypothetical protein [Pseudomonadota bacterium]